MKKRMDEIESFTRAVITSAQRRSANFHSNLSGIISIPVVVHVLYNNSVQNVSDAAIQAQIDLLNQDYGGINPDRNKMPADFLSSASATNIQFCLAKRDPFGKPATGIVRKYTAVTAFIDNDKMKSSSAGGDDPWDPSKYLNLWICNMANGILGYAQFPGGPVNTDGVVILYSSLPGGTSAPYNLGRTATHEIGHWLNLRHIWGDAHCGDDLVEDTPQQESPNFGCPSYPHRTCSNNGDMSMNFMDYSDDACMYVFTAGQAARIRALFLPGGPRASLLSSDGCEPVQQTCSTPVNLVAENITENGARLAWSEVAGATGYNVQYKTVSSSVWNSVSCDGNTKVLSGLINRTAYDFRVQTVCESVSAFSNASSFTTLPGTSCGIPAALHAGSVSTSAATLYWNAVSGAAGYTIQYKAAAADEWTAVSSPSNSVSLSGLYPGTTYLYKVQAVCSTEGVYSAPASFTTYLVTLNCMDAYENNNTFVAAAAIPVNADIKAQISSAADADWYKFSNTGTTPNIKITLSNLPKDYDLELYNASGNFLILSDNVGTTSEGIVYNMAPVGTYYIKVTGYGGTYSPNCYALRAQLSNTLLREMEPAESKSAVKSDNNVSIYPNPSVGNFNIEYHASTEQEVKVTVYDISGKIICTQTYPSEPGENLINMSLPDLMNGVYLLDFNNTTEKSIYKIIVNK
jgi:hypothetical protein